MIYFTHFLRESIGLIYFRVLIVFTAPVIPSTDIQTQNSRVGDMPGK